MIQGTARVAAKVFRNFIGNFKFNNRNAASIAGPIAREIKATTSSTHFLPRGSKPSVLASLQQLLVQVATPPSFQSWRPQEISRSLARLKRLVNMQSLLNSIISLIGFLYRLFIFVQMCCLGYGESLRLRKYVKIVLSNSRKIKIN
jgi:hypothetical protein